MVNTLLWHFGTVDLPANDNPQTISSVFIATLRYLLLNKPGKFLK